MNKLQEKQYNSLVEKLNIKTEGEDFVLKHLLWLDWRRRCIVNYITEIKAHQGLIYVKCNVDRSSYSFSVCDINPEGWIPNANPKQYVEMELQRKIGV